MTTSEYTRAERARQAIWRETSPDLPAEARAPGTFQGRSYAWLLRADQAHHNLLAPIRRPVLDRFARHGIVWHDGDDGPSPNLMDSQVACLNFWCGLADASEEALLAVVRTFAPEAARMVAPVEDGVLVEPEWIGLRNHLGERGRRLRGRYATSADALVAWVDPAGRRHGALIESKYSEAYDGRSCRYSRAGTDRAAIYAPAAAQPWSPLRRDVDLAALMHEPFDQHLRQQLLAAAMEDAGELGFATVRLVHAAPRANRAFHENITAPALSGPTVADAWRSVLRAPARYASVAYEDLARTARDVGSATTWNTGLGARYGWAS